MAHDEAFEIAQTDVGDPPGAALARCAFCNGVLPQWTRFRLWEWSG
jgi:hypothetical protein